MREAFVFFSLLALMLCIECTDRTELTNESTKSMESLVGDYNGWSQDSNYVYYLQMKSNDSVRLVYYAKSFELMVIMDGYGSNQGDSLVLIQLQESYTHSLVMAKNIDSLNIFGDVGMINQVVKSIKFGNGVEIDNLTENDEGLVTVVDSSFNKNSVPIRALLYPPTELFDGTIEVDIPYKGSLDLRCANRMWNFQFNIENFNLEGEFLNPQNMEINLQKVNP